LSRKIGDYPILKYLGSANIENTKRHIEPIYFESKEEPPLLKPTADVRMKSSGIGNLRVLIIAVVVVVVGIVGVIFAVGTLHNASPPTSSSPPLSPPSPPLPTSPETPAGPLLAIVTVVGIISLIFVSLRRKASRKVEESKVSLFISDVINLNKMAMNLELAPAIDQALTHKVEFYRVSLVADFYPSKNSKFKFGRINVELASHSTSQMAAYSTASPTIYSIAPLIVNSEAKITTQYAIDPEFKLTEANSVSVGSISQKKEYTKLHPSIIGHFDKQTASWEFRTTNIMDSIEGVQLLEFTVKQPANIISTWHALPEGELIWRGRTQRFKAAITRDTNPLPKNKLEPFTVPQSVS
jgi:hypothetical protein